MMRVLNIITVKMKLDGVTLSSFRYAKHIDKSKAQITFLAINEPEDSIKKLIKDSGCELHVIPYRLNKPIKYFFELTKYIRQNGFTVVHARGNSSTLAIEMLAAFLGGAKKRIAHSDNSYCTHRIANKVLRPIFSLFTNARLACGREAGEWLFGNKPFEIINVSVDCDAYAYDKAAREKIRTELGLDGKKVIGSVANFTHAKNHRFLIDAFGCLYKADKDARLLLVGSGALFDETKSYIKEKALDDAIIMTGARGDISDILCACDMMALPSIYEGFPSVLVEWQCSGLPVIVSDRVTKDTRLTENVRFLPIEDIDVWAEAFDDITPVDREKASALGIKKAREKGYDIVPNAKKLEKIYLD